jgi:hypothetical protein
MRQATDSGRDGQDDAAPDDKKTITVTVFAPRATQPKSFTWSKHMTVGAAATEAAQAFGYAAGTPTLVKGTKALDREKQLVAAGVRDGDELELTDIGGGV